MLDQLADYTVLELIIGERVVHYLQLAGPLLWLVVIAYAIRHLLRYRHKQQLRRRLNAQRRLAYRPKP